MTTTQTPSPSRNVTNVEITWRNILYAHNRVELGWEGMVMRAKLQNYPMYEWNGRVYDTATNEEVGVTSELFPVEASSIQDRVSPQEASDDDMAPADRWFKKTDTPRQKRDAVAFKVRQMIAEHMGLEVSQIHLRTAFVQDLGADSLDEIELVMILEEELDSDITDEEAETLVTVQHVVDYVMTYFTTHID